MKLLTLARDLRRRKARGREGLFAAEGVRAVEELLKSPVTIRGVLVAPQLSDAPRGAALLDSLRKRGGELAEVSALEFASAAETESPQGVLAVAEIPSWTFDQLPLASRWRIVLLDGVQDPGNVGTIVRTAAALGALAVLAMPGTVDLWNAKVVRSTMGASFHTPAFACTWAALDAFRSGVSVTMWGADAGGRPLDALDIPDRLIIAVGNEGSGLSTDARSRVDALASLPITANVESLNVAVATGILLYQVRS
ncbi:MAG: RNA methyltransferase [Gemmatimonadaceae bacterium]|nr:RNA methyltransferase [Gemmatimonadaceae bacterium]